MNPALVDRPVADLTLDQVESELHRLHHEPRTSENTDRMIKLRFRKSDLHIEHTQSKESEEQKPRPEFVELYEKYSIPGDRPPVPGDIIRTNYGTGMAKGYRVVSVHVVTQDEALDNIGGRRKGDYCFACDLPDGSHKCFTLNGYELTPGGRLVSKPLPPNSAGFLSNGGGRDGDGRGEILIENRAPQGSLF